MNPSKHRRSAAASLSFWKWLFTSAFAFALDAALVIASFHASHWLRLSRPVLALAPLPVDALNPWSSYPTFLAAVVPLWLAIFAYGARLYGDSDLPPEEMAVRVLRACSEGTLITLALSFATHRLAESRLVILGTLPISAVLVWLNHVVVSGVYRELRRRWTAPTSTLVVGGGRAADAVIRHLERRGHRKIRRTPPISAQGIFELVASEGMAEVIVVQANLDRADLLDLADRLEAAGVGLRIVPNLVELRMGEIQIDRSLGAPSFVFYHSSLSGADHRAKRAFDIAFCFTFLVAFALPWAVIAALIKLGSPGPIFFRQRRVGLKGRTFEILKFRTMYVDAAQRLSGLKHLNERKGPVFKMKDDPRVTPVGRWLRKLSLDEVPQIINVLKGEMSVVGPRPPLPSEVAQYDQGALKRLNVLPGITGLWQVSGRADLDFEQMVALDLYYIEHWSLGVDLKIILKTPAAMVCARGAY